MVEEEVRLHLAASMTILQNHMELTDEAKAVAVRGVIANSNAKWGEEPVARALDALRDQLKAKVKGALGR